MSIWHITGGSPLRGQIRVQGSKNAVLPVIAASLLCGAETELLNCPNLSDVDAAMDILRYLGCTAARCGDALCIDTTAPARCDIPRELIHRMRSSVIFLGPLLGGGIAPRRLRARPAADRSPSARPAASGRGDRGGRGQHRVPGFAPSRRGDIACAAERRRNGKRHDRRLRGGGDDRHL